MIRLQPLRQSLQGRKMDAMKIAHMVSHLVSHLPSRMSSPS
jgi:hypothetical protein